MSAVCSNKLCSTFFNFFLMPKFETYNYTAYIPTDIKMVKVLLTVYKVHCKTFQVNWTCNSKMFHVHTKSSWSILGRWLISYTGD